MALVGTQVRGRLGRYLDKVNRNQQSLQPELLRTSSDLCIGYFPAAVIKVL